jgi:hypothetical protein
MQEDKLTRLLRAKTESEAAVFETINELEDKIDAIRSEIPDLGVVLKAVKGQKGDPGETIKGDKGDTGPEGPKGPPGEDGTDGIDGKDGRDGKNGKPGKDGKDGKDGLIGRDGKDGEKGDPGDLPKHEVKNGWFRFETPKGGWGKWIRAGGKDTGGQMFGAAPSDQIVVSATAPRNPYKNQLWVDIA